MKKVIFISALAIAAAVSCTKSDIVDTKFNEQISFENYIGRDAMTKAAVADVDALKDAKYEGIGLYGFYTGAGEWTSQTSSNLWGNAKLYWNTTVTPNAWTYEGGTKYWTNNEDNYTFLAYAPYNNKYLTVASGLTVKEPTVKYNLPEALSEQIDLLHAAVLNTNKDKSANGVNLVFEHALSRITVKASEAAGEFDYKIYGVKITANFPKENTLTLSDGKWGTTPATTEDVEYVIMPMTKDADNKITSTGVKVTGTDAPHDFAGTNKDNYLMVIPTPEVAGAKTDITLEVVYTTIFDEKESNPMTKTLDLSVDFDKGYAYSFDLVFSPNQDNEITFNVSVNKWATDGNDTPVLDNTDDEETPRNDNPENWE